MWCDDGEGVNPPSRCPPRMALFRLSTPSSSPSREVPSSWCPHFPLPPLHRAAALVLGGEAEGGGEPFLFVSSSGGECIRWGEAEKESPRPRPLPPPRPRVGREAGVARGATKPAVEGVATPWLEAPVCVATGPLARRALRATGGPSDWSPTVSWGGSPPLIGEVEEEEG